VLLLLHKDVIQSSSSNLILSAPPILFRVFPPKSRFFKPPTGSVSKIALLCCFAGQDFWMRGLTSTCETAGLPSQFSLASENVGVTGFGYACRRAWSFAANFTVPGVLPTVAGRCGVAALEESLRRGVRGKFRLRVRLRVFSAAASCSRPRSIMY